MAWVRTLPSGKYEGRYRGPDKKTRTVPGGPFVHKAEARRVAAAAEADSRSLGWRDPAAAGRTWREWCEEWWPSRKVAASTMKTDVGTRDLHLMTRWGDVPLIDITRQDVKKWAAELRSTTDEDGEVTIHHAASTVRNIVYLLSSSLRAAVDAEILVANVAADLKLPQPAPGKERFLDRDEFDKLVDQLQGADRAMVLLLAGTGMRWGEAAGLHRHRIDLRRGMIEIVEAHVISANHIAPVPKGKRMRSVPIAPWVDLSALDTDGPDTCGVEHLEGHCRSGLLLTADVGKHKGNLITHASFSPRFDKAVADAGLGHVRIHDLRHTYASWLLQGGRSIAEVGKLLGHVSAVTTERYSWLAELASKDVLNALGPGPGTPTPALVDELAARRARRSASA
ncbi:site-specific integrase [Myceligenerans halotolerans]